MSRFFRVRLGEEMAESRRRMTDRLFFVVVALGGLSDPSWFNLEVCDQRVCRTEIVPLPGGVLPDVIAAVRFAKREMAADRRLVNLPQFFGNWREQGAS